MTEPKETLKPCPFCGCWNVSSFRHNAGGWGVSFHVECLADKCGNGTRHHETEAKAIAAWNTRADAAENAALREKLAVARETLTYIWETSPNLHDVGRARDALDALTGGDNAEG